MTKDFLENLNIIIDKGDQNEANQLLKDLHAADIAEICNELDTEKAKFLYTVLDGEKAADVLAELEEDEREELKKKSLEYSKVPKRPLCDF